MRSEVLSLLACATCGDELVVEGSEGGDEIREGVLRCGGCGTVLPVVSGIPRPAGTDPAQARVADAFSSQWNAYRRGAFEQGTVYGRTEAGLWEFIREATGLGDPELAGLVVLDAGCGPGSFSRQIAQHGADTVIALDISDAVDVISAETHDLTNLDVIQADVFAAPLRPAFDLVWSTGVIHHTSDAFGAFRALTKYVRPGGLLYVWVYPRDLRPFHWGNVTQWAQACLSRLGLRRLSDSAIYRLAGCLSYPSVGLHRLYRAARRLPGLRPTTTNARDSVIPRTRRVFHLIWNDALAPPHNSWHSEGEVVDWFRAAGFSEIVTAPNRPLGVRGRAPVN
jgi:SAM-dependent methyltransferase/uncharacterized protein YbaR (Trm112 family)